MARLQRAALFGMPGYCIAVFRPITLTIINLSLALLSTAETFNATDRRRRCSSVFNTHQPAARRGRNHEELAPWISGSMANVH
jgi:hypothetical protein